MATSTLVPLDLYLKTSYRPDCDWIDGEVMERNMGEAAHATIQAFLIDFFRQHRGQWGVRVVPEQRVQVSTSRLRVPDVALVRVSDAFEPIVRTAPMLCVEILSSEDRLNRIQERAADYLAMGVPMVWIIDPRHRRAYLSDESGLRQVTDTLSVPGTDIRMTVEEVFAELNELEGRI